MDNRKVAYKGFVICLVLFCAYMQWSPVVDFDYVWINGHEHFVGAADGHQMDGAAIPTLPQSVGVFLNDCVIQLLELPVKQSAEGLATATTLRL